ncbi:MAG: extracellular solute-binding protein [Candidatus Paceibacterota bacterium]|jgi:ABC-type glycerol-3-phosphate transport system substrate-binding protein
MSGKSLFQTILLVLLGAALVVAVLIFAGVLPGFRQKKVGQAGEVVVWGSFSDNSFIQMMTTDLPQGHEKEFSVRYFDKGADLESSLINALASGQGPDVIIAPHELILKQRDKFALIPFTSVPLRSYQDTFVDEGDLFVVKDGFMALPLSIDPLLLYYNKDVYNNVNLLKAPTNWEEFIKIQPILTKVGELHRLEQSAFALGTFGNNNNAKDILSLLILQAGGSPAVSNDGQISVTLNNDFGFSIKPAQAALSFFLQFADPVKSTYCWNRSLPEARDSFLGESLVNYFGFGSEASYLREKNPHLNLNLSIVPQMEGKNRLTFGRLYGVAVLKTSTKLSATWPMIFALTGQEHSQKAADILNLAPSRRALLVPDPAKPDQKVIFDSALISRGWYDFAPAEIKNLFQTMNDNAATGRLSPSEAVEQAAGEISKLINPSQ